MVEVKDKDFLVITSLLIILDDIFDDCLASEGVPRYKMLKYKIGKTHLKRLFKQLNIQK